MSPKAKVKLPREFWTGGEGFAMLGRDLPPDDIRARIKEMISQGRLRKETEIPSPLAIRKAKLRHRKRGSRGKTKAAAGAVRAAESLLENAGDSFFASEAVEFAAVLLGEGYRRAMENLRSERDEAVRERDGLREEMKTLQRRLDVDAQQKMRERAEGALAVSGE